MTGTPDAIADPIYFDLEATGPDPYSDRIWEISFMECWGEPKTWRFDPGQPLDEEVTEMTGVTWEDLEGEPSFSYRAAAIQERFQGKILTGYNVRQFDTILLNRELKEAGQDGLDLIQVTEADLFRVWLTCEGRSLADALQRFLGVNLGEEAHSAEADTRHLPDLLAAMMNEFGLNWEDVLDMSAPEDELDRAGKFRLNEHGAVVFAFGKHEGEAVANRPQYVSWMMRSDFPEDTKDIIRTLRRNDFVWPPPGDQE